MTNVQSTESSTPTARCGCCGRTRDRSRLAELGETPGVFICAGCALWAARRAARRGVGVPVRVWWRRWHARRVGSMARSAVPILESGDLDLSEEFYARLGFEVAGRYDGYLVTHDGPVELHLSAAADPTRVTAATCFVQVRDATRSWKQLRERRVEGVGDPGERVPGVVEFLVVDPFGNRIRFGSPALGERADR